jgi:nitrite reductase (NADH) small subunit
MNARITRARWVEVSTLGELQPDSAVSVTLGRLQLAVVRVGNGDGVYAIDSFDPFAKAYLLGRGSVGERAGVPELRSPFGRHHFSLLSGECRENAAVQVPVYPARVREGRIEVQVPVSTLDSFESLEAAL